MKFQQISPDGIFPSKNNETDAGYDLFSPRDYILKANSKLLIPLDIACKMEPLKINDKVCLKTWLEFKPCSSVAKKQNWLVDAGVIDMTYIDNLKVLLLNYSEKDIEIRRGDRLCQCIYQVYVDDGLQLFFYGSKNGFYQKSNRGFHEEEKSLKKLNEQSKVNDLKEKLTGGIITEEEYINNLRALCVRGEIKESLYATLMSEVYANNPGINSVVKPIL